MLSRVLLEKQLEQPMPFAVVAAAVVAAAAGLKQVAMVALAAMMTAKKTGVVVATVSEEALVPGQGNSNHSAVKMETETLNVRI